MSVLALSRRPPPCVSPILTAYTQAYPKVALVVTTGTSCSLVEDVLAHRLDGAFVAGLSTMPISWKCRFSGKS